MKKPRKGPCEICKKVELLVTHHIHGRNVPKANQKWNIVKICSNCHYAIHAGEIIIEGWISTTSGKELFFHRRGEESFTGEKAEPHLFFKDSSLSSNSSGHSFLSEL